MKTVAEQIAAEANLILADLRALMAVSRVEQVKSKKVYGVVGNLIPDNWLAPYEVPINASGRAHPVYTWAELSPEGRTIQGKVQIRYNGFFEHVQVLLAGQPKPMLAKFMIDDKRLRQAIAQGHSSLLYKSVQELVPEVEAALQRQVELVKELYSATDQPIYIPDTNALLHNPDIEGWGTMHPPGFTIYLVPTVLSELDELKINHRNPDVRDKAEKIIRKVKDYRRRGSILEGVVIAGKIRLRAMAVEPKEKVLAWLDLGNNDDRILAMAMTIMRENVHAPVVLITRDINLQNKCEMARLPCIEPPDAAAASNSP